MINLSSVKQQRNLKAIDKLVYLQLAFRMRLSINHRQFKSNGKSFVIYKVKNLMHDLGTSRYSILMALKRLSKKGLILRIRKIHFTKIFLPGLNLKSSKEKSENQTSKSLKIRPLVKVKDKVKDSVCGTTRKAVKPLKKSNNKLVKAFKSNWEPHQNDVIKLDQLSSNFSTKLILKAIKITKYKEFKTTPLNFITGVIRRLVLEAKKPKHKPKQIKFKRGFRAIKSRRKQHSIKALTKFYDPELVYYANNLTKATHKIIYNKFNFVAGILFRFKKLGITTVTAAKAYEINPNYGRNYLQQKNLASEQLPDENKKDHSSKVNQQKQSKPSKEKIKKLKKWCKKENASINAVLKKKAAKREAARRAKLEKAKKAKATAQAASAKARKIAIRKISGILGTN